MSESQSTKPTSPTLPKEVALPETPAGSRILNAGPERNESPDLVKWDQHSPTSPTSPTAKDHDQQPLSVAHAGGVHEPERTKSLPHPSERSPSQSAEGKAKSDALSDMLHESIASIDPTKSHTSVLPDVAPVVAAEPEEVKDDESLPVGLSDRSQIPEVPSLPTASAPVKAAAPALEEEEELVPDEQVVSMAPVDASKNDSEPSTPTTSEPATPTETSAAKAKANKKKNEKKKAKKAAAAAAAASGEAPLDELAVKDESADMEAAHPTDIAPVSGDALVSEMPAAPHVQESKKEIVKSADAAVAEPEDSSVPTAGEPLVSDMPAAPHVEQAKQEEVKPVEEPASEVEDFAEAEDSSVPTAGEPLVSDMPAAPHVAEAKQEEISNEGESQHIEHAEEKSAPVEDQPEPIKPKDGKDASVSAATTASLVSVMPAAPHVSETKGEEDRTTESDEPKASKPAHISTKVRTGGLVSDMPSASHVEKAEHAGSTSPSVEKAEHLSVPRSDSPATGVTADGTPLSAMPIDTRHVNDAADVTSPMPSGYLSPEVKDAMTLHERLQREDPACAPAPSQTYSPRTQSPERERRSASPSPSPRKLEFADQANVAPEVENTHPDEPAVERLPEPEPTREPEDAQPLDAIPSAETQVKAAPGLSTLEPEIFPPAPVDQEGERRLEEQMAEVPPEPEAEANDLVAQELGLDQDEVAEPAASHDEVPAALKEEDKKIELPEPTAETVATEAEERTPVLVSPPKDTAEDVAAASPSDSKVSPVFVGQAPTLSGTSKLAELTDEQTPAAEYSLEETLQEKRETSEASQKEQAPAVPAVASELDVPDDAEPASQPSTFGFIAPPNPTETPLVKSEEEQKEERDQALMGAGAMGAVGAGLAGIAMSASGGERVDETSGQKSEEPRASSAIPASVLERLEKNTTEKNTETSNSSVFAEPATTPASELPPVAAATTPTTDHTKEPSPVASPDDVFARGDVPAGTLLSPDGLRKEGDENSAEVPLEGATPATPEYFGSSLALPKEVDNAQETVNSGIPTREPSPKDTAAAPASDESKVVSSAVPTTASSLDAPTPNEVPPASSSSSSTLLSTPVALTKTDNKMEAQPHASSSTAPPLAVFGAPSSDADPSAAYTNSEAVSKPVADTSNMRWSLKRMSWPDPRVGGERREVRVICQNENGPCSLISLVNVLVLRGSIHIDPAVKSVSYDYLSSLIGDFLIERPPGSSNLTLSSALSILPTTVQGLNVNPSFLSHSSFVPEGDGGELALFELCGAKLTHGWVVDSEEDKELFGRVGAWDACQARMVEGQVAEGELERTGGVDESGMGKIEDANRIRTFLDSSLTQLTPSGLSALSASLEPREVVAFFRNSHLSVLYKRPADPANPVNHQEPLLFSLVTDESFRSEPEVVWEPLFASVSESTGFVNSEFGRASTAGGDVAGMTAEEVARRADRDGAGGQGEDDDYDTQLARQLQEDEDANAAQVLAADGTPRTSTSRREEQTPLAQQAAKEKKEKSEKKEKKKGRGCAIM